MSTGNPKCRLCGAEHAFSAPHKFAGDIPGRGAEASVPEPATARISKSEDEVAAPAAATQTVESSQPPRKSRKVKAPRAPRTKFDRNAYQRDYMRDVPFAKADGLTVGKWRAKQKDRGNVGGINIYCARP